MIIKHMSPNGKDAVHGKTAYEIAKEVDPDIGTYEDWRESLRGDAGGDGANGKDGRTISSITLNADETGTITGGQIQFSDESTAELVVMTTGEATSELLTDKGESMLTDDGDDIIAVLKL